MNLRARGCGAPAPDASVRAEPAFEPVAFEDSVALSDSPDLQQDRINEPHARGTGHPWIAVAIGNGAAMFER